jgi:3-oxoacyl-[acyl-carrier-protein] synthase-3
MMRAGIIGAAAYLPPHRLSSRQVEQRIAAASDGFVPHATIVERLTGIRERHVAAADQQASDLAAAATAKLLADKGIASSNVDLLLFASASQDLVEPATAHIVAAKLGLACPVFDVKNACNSFLNGLQVADALIRIGRYRTVVVCTGEIPSRAVRWRVRDRAQFVDAFAGYTLSDGGAAVLLQRTDTGGIFHVEFVADSSMWEAGTLPAGGSMHPRGEEYTYFSGDGRKLRDAFLRMGPQIFTDALAKTGMSWDGFAAVFVHQVTLPYLEVLRDILGIPAGRLVVTLADHGNLASATLPLQLAQALEAGRCRPGDKVAFIGLAGGVSLGIVFAEL